MGKKVGSIFAGLLFAVLGVFLAVEGSDAFCIKNNSDHVMIAVQASGHQWGRGYSGSIDSGDMACVDWNNETVNVEGKRDSTLTFQIKWFGYSMEWHSYYTRIICNDFPIKASGNLVIKGHDGNYKCEAHE